MGGFLAAHQHPLGIQDALQHRTELLKKSNKTKKKYCPVRKVSLSVFHCTTRKGRSELSVFVLSSAATVGLLLNSEMGWLDGGSQDQKTNLAQSAGTSLSPPVMRGCRDSDLPEDG